LKVLSELGKNNAERHTPSCIEKQNKQFLWFLSASEYINDNTELLSSKNYNYVMNRYFDNQLQSQKANI